MVDNIASGAEKKANQARRKIAALEDERRKLLQAHYAGAIPVELLKEEQDRISRQIANQGVALANTEIDQEAFNKNLQAALQLANHFGNAYLYSKPTIRRQLNQAVFSAIYIDTPGIVGTKLAEPWSSLVGSDLIGQLEAEIEKRTGVDEIPGSRLNCLVERNRLLSNS